MGNENLTAIQVAANSWVTIDEWVKFKVRPSITDKAIVCTNGRISQWHCLGPADVPVSDDDLDLFLAGQPLSLQRQLDEFLKLNPKRFNSEAPNYIYAQWRAKHGRRLKPKLIWVENKRIAPVFDPESNGYKSGAGIEGVITLYYFENDEQPLVHDPKRLNEKLQRKQDRAARRSPKHGLHDGPEGVLRNGRKLSEITTGYTVHNVPATAPTEAELLMAQRGRELGLYQLDQVGLGELYRAMLRRTNSALGNQTQPDLPPT
jgi:hypothetical protein